MATNTTGKLSPADEIIGNDNTIMGTSSNRNGGLLSMSHRQNSLQSLQDGIESISDEFDTSTGTTRGAEERSKISSETNNNNVDWDALFEDDEPEAISDPAGVLVGGSSSSRPEEDGGAASTLLSSSMGASLPIITGGRGKVMSLTTPNEPDRASTTISRTVSTSYPRRTTTMEDMEMEVRRIYQNKVLLSSPPQQVQLASTAVVKKDMNVSSPVSSLVPHLPSTMMTKSFQVEQQRRTSSSSLYPTLLNDPLQDTTPVTSNNNNKCSRKDIKKYSAMMERTRRPLPPGGHELREVRAKTIAQSKDETLPALMTLGEPAAVLPPLEPALPALPFPVRCSSSSRRRTDAVVQPPPSPPPSLLSQQQPQQPQQPQYHWNPQSPNDMIQSSDERELYYHGQEQRHYYHGDHHSSLLRTQGSRAYHHHHPTEQHQFGPARILEQHQNAHHQEGKMLHNYYHRAEADCRNRDPYRDRDSTTGGGVHYLRERQAFVSPMMASQGISSRDNRDAIASPRPEDAELYNQKQHPPPPRSYYHSPGGRNDSSTPPYYYYDENGCPTKTRPEPLPRERERERNSSSMSYHHSNYYHEEHIKKTSWAAERTRSISSTTGPYYQDAPPPPPPGYVAPAPASPASKKARSPHVTTSNHNHRRPCFHQASSDELKGLLEPILVPPSENGPPLTLPPTKCIEICQADGTKRKYQMMYTALKVPRDMAPAYMKQMKFATERLLKTMKTTTTNNNNKTTSSFAPPEPSPVMSHCHNGLAKSSPLPPQS